MKKALLSVAMAAVISLSATAISSTVVGAVSSNLATPKITKAESVDGGVKISWNKSNGAEKYRVYYKGSKGWTRMVDTTSTSYIDKDVSSGKNYTYTVRCINSSATKFTSGYDSKGKSVKYISAPAEHTHSWQKITKETQVKVVDEEATVKQMQTVVCSEPTCQNDLSGYTSEQISEHMKQHALNGENAGWHTSTKTVEVPEKFHYETKTEVVGRKCTECGEIEYY